MPAELKIDKICKKTSTSFDKVVIYPTAHRMYMLFFFCEENINVTLLNSQQPYLSHLCIL